MQTTTLIHLSDTKTATRLYTELHNLQTTITKSDCCPNTANASQLQDDRNPY